MTINIKSSQKGSFVVFIVIFMMYFIPKYLEFTMLSTYDPVSQIIEMAKKISYTGSFIFLFLSLIIKGLIKGHFSIKMENVLQWLVLLYFTYEGFAKGRNSIFVVLCLGLLFQSQFLNDFLKVVLLVSSILFGMTIFFSICNIIPDVLTPFQKLGFSTFRHSLGFNYPGQLMMQFVPIVMCYYYLNRKHINWITNGVFILLSTIVFAASKTIMGYVLILCFIFIFNRIKNNEAEVLTFITKKKIVRFMPFIVCIFTFLLMCLYKFSFGLAYKLDVIMNSRIKLGAVFWGIYGIKLFGTAFENDMRYYYQVLDSDYMYMLIACGIIYTIIAMWLITKVLDYIIHNGDIYLFVIYTVLIINSIANNGLFNYCLNPFAIITFMSIGKNLSYSNGSNRNMRPILNVS